MKLRLDESSITAEMVRELLSYDPDSGLFSWKKTLSNRAVAGSSTGRAKSRGYLLIRLFGTLYKAHRIAWLYMTGSWPEFDIDHKNRIRDDNRWINLREATCSQNLCNAGIRSNNTSGFKGVSWSKRSARWVAHIRVEGQSKNLGLFSTPEEAHAAYKNAAARFFGEFANFGE